MTQRKRVASARLAHRLLALGAGAVVSALCGAAACAQAWPARPVRFVVASPPGGAPDLLARTVAAKLGEALGQQLVVDNRSGASGVIGAEAVARATPDGHTLLLTTTTLHATLPLLKKRLPYDTDRNFALVTRLAWAANVVAVNAAVGAASIGDLTQIARAKPTSLNFGSAGSGTPAHLAGEMLNLLAGLRMVHVPYKGAAPAMADLVAGQIQLLITSPLVATSQAASGRVRLLATTGAQRDPLLPQLPTVAETVPGYDITQWWGIALPARTPRAIVERLQAEAAKALNQPDVRERLRQQAATPVGDRPEQFTAFAAEERARMARLIRQAGIPRED